MNRISTQAAPDRHPDKGAAEQPDWPQLKSGEIHVWKASLDECAHEENRALLSPDEVARAGRYRFAQDRVHFETGRAVLRMILGGYLGREPADLVFRSGLHGKPRLAMDEWEEPLYFNVTHTDSIALYAVARGGEVGIDIERVREIPDWAGIADNLFSPDEQVRLRSLSADQRNQAFLQVWTRQEALLKASGEGLAGKNDGRLSAQESGFSVQSLTPAPGYLAALANGFSAEKMIFMTWVGRPALHPLPNG